MTVYDPALVASSTGIVGDAGHYLYATVWGFMPIVLTILIPLALLFGAYHMIRSRAHLR